jgi:hypothetical protein
MSTIPISLMVAELGAFFVTRQAARRLNKKDAMDQRPSLGGHSSPRDAIYVGLFSAKSKHDRAIRQASPAQPRAVAEWSQNRISSGPLSANMVIAGCDTRA